MAAPRKYTVVTDNRSAITPIEQEKTVDVAELISFLPVQTAESLATVLTMEDVATLKHLHKKSIPDNTLRAIASDLAYLEAWHRAATGAALTWPAGEDAALKFLAHHLFDPAVKVTDGSHGMPDAVQQALTASGALKTHLPHAPSTVRRRISHWKKLHLARNLEHPFDSNGVRVALKAAVKASDRKPAAKSEKAVTKDVLDALIETCGRMRVIDIRDKAMLLLAFGSGGRRRSELAGFKLEDVAPSLSQPNESGEPYAILLRRAKRTSLQDNTHIYVAGRAARALEDWARCMVRWKVDMSKGPIFRRVDRWSNIWAQPVSEALLNSMLKERLKLAGLNSKAYSAHGIRAGFMTEARNRGIPLEEAMAHSHHKSYQVASQYYKAGDAKESRALKVAD